MRNGGPIVTLHRKARTLNRELKDAERALGDDPSEANLAWIRDVQNRLAALEGTEALIEGFGASSGRWWLGSLTPVSGLFLAECRVYGAQGAYGVNPHLTPRDSRCGNWHLAAGLRVHETRAIG